MRLHDNLSKLVDRTEREINRLYQQYQAGEISEQRFEVLAAALLAHARRRGVTLADLTLAVALQASPVGVELPDTEQQRLRGSIRTVLTEEVQVETPEEKRESIASRLARLARDAPAEAAVWGLGVAMARRGVAGWTRQTGLKPCQMCINLADGVVRSPEIQMIRHTGCGCIQNFVI